MPLSARFRAAFPNVILLYLIRIWALPLRFFDCEKPDF